MRATLYAAKNGERVEVTKLALSPDSGLGKLVTDTKTWPDVLWFDNEAFALVDWNSDAAEYDQTSSFDINSNPLDP